MKSIFAAAALIAMTTVFACTKESNPVTDATPTAASADASGNQIASLVTAQARYSGANYSQSISPDTANKMLASYLNSVGYPTVDTAMRSFNFDADTLRAYLQNQEITTLKFMVAHKPEYVNSSKNGKFAGMNPNALTFVIVGLNDNEQYITNNQGAVYDHVRSCPANCSDDVNNPYIY